MTPLTFRGPIHHLLGVGFFAGSPLYIALLDLVLEFSDGLRLWRGCPAGIAGIGNPWVGTVFTLAVHVRPLFVILILLKYGTGFRLLDIDIGRWRHTVSGDFVFLLRILSNLNAIIASSGRGFGIPLIISESAFSGAILCYWRRGRCRFLTAPHLLMQTPLLLLLRPLLELQLQLRYL